MKDAQGTIIYVGKANNIKKRVSQYFASNLSDYKTQLLVQHIHSIDPIITQNEHRALLLENQLIKQYQPKYNVLLKDDKSYPYIKITTNEPFPRILITRKKSNDKALYFGPYTSYGSSKKLKQALYHVFPIRDCTQPIDTVTLQPKCIKLDIGKCIGPCIYKHIADTYNDHIQQCILFLKGKNDTVLKKLESDMATAAAAQRYESAATLRDHIQHLRNIQDQYSAPLESAAHYFFIAHTHNEHFHYMVIRHYHRHQFKSQHGQYAPATIDPKLFVSECLSQWMAQRPKAVCHIIPDPDLLPSLDHLPTLPDTVRLHTPERGQLHELQQLVLLNAKKALLTLSKSALKQLQPPPLLQLQKDIPLPHVPHIIMGCDISHFYGTDIVSSVVVFIDGKPAKHLYRHFNIRSVTTGKSDDVKSMKETVARLITHYDTPPNLILIDGGKGQLNAALSALSTANAAHIPCVALAKKNEELYTPHHTTPLQLPYHHTGLNLLRHVRDEAHRFALKFQRTKRKT
jgi:excinuclease ABC subunit C